jgi:protein O-GlcNAc transferase
MTLESDVARQRALDALQAADYSRAKAALETIEPEFWTATDFSNLGYVCLQLGDIDAAARAIDAALALEPSHTAALSNRAHLLQLAGNEVEAEALLRRLLETGEPHVVWSLAGLILKRGAVTEAVQLLRHALEAHPGEERLWNNLGMAWLEAGEPSRAVAALDQALALGGAGSPALSNQIMAGLYHPALQPRQLPEGYWRHAGYARVVTDTAPPRVLGMVTADAYLHPVGRMLDLLLPALSRLGLEVHVFNDSRRRDALTNRLSESATLHDICGWSNAAVAGLAQSLGVDTLIDLNGHTARGRVGLMSHRHCPRQFCWYGLPMGSGARHCDATLVGADLLTAGSELFFPEPVIPTDNAHLMTTAPTEVAVRPPPYIRRGFITFGSFNNIAKINDRTVDLWSRVLRAVPRSRLILKWRSFADPVLRQSFAARFAVADIDPERIEFRGASDYEALLDEYGDIDIALDPWPFGGGMTSMESLWMGVPLVTLSGVRPISRQGESLLRAISRAHWVAHTEVQYVDIARELASNPHTIVSLRRSLRAEMAASVICDGDKNAEAFTTALATAATIVRDWQPR